MRRLFCCLYIFLLGAGCTALAPRDGDILVLGDSVMAWNGGVDADIAPVIADSLGRAVSGRAVPGAMFSNPSRVAGALGFDIRAQHPGGRWNWVVLNGGANDFGLGDCGCGDCSAELARLISSDARDGQIPDFLNRVVASGSRVLWMGYYTSPGTSFRGCTDDLAALERRIDAYATRSASVEFFDGDRVIDRGNPTHFAADGTHPSPRGSALLGTALADVIRRAEDRSQNP